MPKDDEIDAQVELDREFTRRAQQLMSRLRTQETSAGLSPENNPDDDKDGE